MTRKANMGWFSRSFPSVARLFSGGKTDRKKPKAASRRGRKRNSAEELGTLGVAAPPPVTDESGGLEAGAEPPPGDLPGPEEPVVVQEHVAAEVPLAGEAGAEPPPGDLPGPEEMAVVQEHVAVEGPKAGEAVDEPPPEERGAPPESPAPEVQTVSLAQMYDAWVELEGTIGSAHEELETMLANRKRAALSRKEAQETLYQAEAAWEEARRLGEAAWRAFDRGFTVNLPGFAERLRTIKEIDEARKAKEELQRARNDEAWEEADGARQKATAGLLKALTSFTVAATQVERELREAENLSAGAQSLKGSAMEDLRCAQTIGNELTALVQEALDQLEVTPGAPQGRWDERLTQEPIEGTLGPEQEAMAPAPAPPEVSAEVSAEEQVSPENLSGLGAPAGGIEGSIAGLPGGVEAPPAEIGPVESAPMSAAEQLRREFEAAAFSVGAQEIAAPVSAEGAGEGMEGSGAVVAGPEGAAPQEAEIPTPEVPAPPAEEQAVSGAVAETYSGRLYLMFPSSLGSGAVESVWETLEEAAGPGAIVDTRLVSAAAGVQFTLELGKRALSVEDLRKRMPGARLEALEPDRLKVHWPP